MTVLKGVQEFFNGTIIKRVYRYNLVVCKNNTDGNGNVKCVAIVKGIIFCRGFYYNEFYIVLQFITGAFINIQGIGKKINGDI